MSGRLPLLAAPPPVDMAAGLPLTRPAVLRSLGGLALPLLIPFLQFGLVYKLWQRYAMPVHRDHCSNSCWDTVFKANYETGAGTYKHVYFNATLQAWLMWLLTLVAVLALYEANKYLLQLFLARQLRARMALMFLASVYPHYYGWWVFWNYINDDFYEQIFHQLFFTVTEAISSLMILHLADRGVQASPERLLVIISIAAGHVAASGWDQFVTNVLLGDGGLHQILRDLGFMLPDLVNIVLPILELRCLAASRKLHPAYLVSNQMALKFLLTVAGIWGIATLL